jgi:hypothetical protein
MRFHFAGHTVAVSATVAVLAGCGGSQGPMPAVPAGAGAFGAPQIARVPSRGPLLYVAHVFGSGNLAHTVIAVLSLRQQKMVANITGYGYATGVCADASGNVWVPYYRHHNWYVDKFARDGTKPVAELRPPKASYLAGCAVDPGSGDLAVMDNGKSAAVIWRGAREGKPATYAVPFSPLNAAYDGTGDLFVTGYAGDSDVLFEFGELTKGSGAVTSVTLDKPVGGPGAVQWDGMYAEVATNVNRNRLNSKARVYRVQVSGTTGKVVDVVRPQDFYHTLFVLHDRAVIGLARRSGEQIWVWPYPGGGKPTQRLTGFDTVNAIAVSP